MDYSLAGLTGLEPVTTGLTDRGSTIELQTNKLFHYVDFSLTFATSGICPQVVPNGSTWHSFVPFLLH